jgi:molybdopterin converting factor small subunit
MKVCIRGFGQAGDFLGKEALLDFQEGATLERLKAVLIERYPGLEELWPAMAIAVNDEVVEMDKVLAEGDEVFLIPPVSGG